MGLGACRKRSEEHCAGDPPPIDLPKLAQKRFPEGQVNPDAEGSHPSVGEMVDTSTEPGKKKPTILKRRPPDETMTACPPDGGGLRPNNREWVTARVCLGKNITDISELLVPSLGPMIGPKIGTKTPLIFLTRFSSVGVLTAVPLALGSVVEAKPWVSEFWLGPGPWWWREEGLGGAPE